MHSKLGANATECTILTSYYSDGVPRQWHKNIGVSYTCIVTCKTWCEGRRETIATIYITLYRSSLRSGAFYARRGSSSTFPAARKKHLQVECSVGLVTQQEGIHTAGWGEGATHLPQAGVPRRTTVGCYAPQPRFKLQNRPGEASISNPHPQLKQVGAHAA